MEKILTQEEINALLRAAQETAAPLAGSQQARKFSPFVFGKAAQIAKQQVRDVAQVHEAFVYRLKNRLSAYLQVTLEINPMSVDEVTYAEFVQSLPQQSYLGSINIQPTHSVAILSLDLPVAFAMIDLMLGGDGKPQTPARPATEIEEKVLQSVLNMICEELHVAWRQVVEIDFTFDQTQRVAELFRLMPPHEKILFLSFEIRMLDIFSTLTLAFPAAASSLLLGKLAKRSIRNQRLTPESGALVRKRLQDCIFVIEMLLPPTRITGKDLLGLSSGQTILIQHRTTQPAVLKVAGNVMFTSHPVRSGAQRAGMIQRKFPVLLPAERANP